MLVPPIQRQIFRGRRHVQHVGNSSQRPTPSTIRESVAATVGRRKVNGAVACALPRSPDHESKLGHKLVYVVVVAVVKLCTSPSFPFLRAHSR
jgi:hypothetical protein